MAQRTTKKSRASKRAAAAPKRQNKPKVYTGVKKDPLDLRDLLYEGSLRELPHELDNRSKVPVILDQGIEGACTGFGLAAMVNYLLQNRAEPSGQPGKSVSARMLYEMAKRYDEWEGEHYEGSSIRGAMKGWHKHGVCTEDKWPYDPNRPGHFTPSAQVDALQRPLGNYFRVRHHHLNQMHSALIETGVLYASAMVHEGWNRVTARNWRIKYDPDQIGGHAFAIVGYDKEGFIIQNSWGYTWGKKGFAHLTYDDWLENSMDCWVARLGVPTQSVALAGDAGRRKAATFDHIQHEEVVMSRIRPHFVNLGNDGQFSQSGRYSTEPEDLERIVQTKFVEKTAEWGGTPRLMLYAHGGLNDEKASASRIATMLPYFLDNHVYPLHFMWETGVGETISGIVQDAFRRGPLRSWGDDLKDRLYDLLDEAIELGARPIGKPLWSQMKQNAEAASATRKSGARAVAERISKYIAQQGPIEVHLVGHSAGSIFHAYLVPQLVKLGVPIKTLSLFAPACTMELFENNYLPHLNQGVERLTVFNLTDETEQDDKVGPAYHKSLLYLVSEAFELSKSTPLAGMDKFWRDITPATQKLGAPVFKSERTLIRNIGGPDVRLRSASRSHGGFDNDEDSMNSVLRIILGKNRLRRYF